jgi:hypothetical protein
LEMRGVFPAVSWLFAGAPNTLDLAKLPDLRTVPQSRSIGDLMV